MYVFRTYLSPRGIAQTVSFKSLFPNAAQPYFFSSWKAEWHWDFKTNRDRHDLSKRHAGALCKLRPAASPSAKFSVAIPHCVLLSSRFMWLRWKGEGEPVLLIKVKYVGLETQSASLARFPESGYRCQIVSVYHFQPYYHSLCIPG